MDDLSWKTPCFWCYGFVAVVLVLTYKISPNSSSSEENKEDCRQIMVCTINIQHIANHLAAVNLVVGLWFRGAAARSGG